MPSPNNPPRKACNKLRYPTRERAEVGLSVVMGKNLCANDYARNEGLHVYRCPECGQWHVGHKQYAGN